MAICRWFVDDLTKCQNLSWIVIVANGEIKKCHAASIFAIFKTEIRTGILDNENLKKKMKIHYGTQAQSQEQGSHIVFDLLFERRNNWWRIVDWPLHHILGCSSLWQFIGTGHLLVYGSWVGELTVYCAHFVWSISRCEMVRWNHGRYYTVFHPHSKFVCENIFYTVFARRIDSLFNAVFLSRSSTTWHSFR